MPVERMRMRPWLEEQINASKIPGLKWVNKEKGIFQIPWMHAARHGWDVERDAPLFRNWAIHTGKFQPGTDKPDPKTWKANFRCAMNSLPDIEEVKDKSIKKGTNAFRVYKMLSPSERQTKRGKKRSEKEDKIKREASPSAWDRTNGYRHTRSVQLKKEPLDYTTPPLSRSPVDEQLIISDLPDVCQTIEVMTESDEQTVSSSHHYPLQISPISAYDSDTDSVHSPEDTKEALWHPLHRAPNTRVPTCSLPGMATFVYPNKAKSEPISTQGPSVLTTPLVPIPMSWIVGVEQQSLQSQPSLLQMPLALPPPPQPLPVPGPSGQASGQASGHETRASVIMKTADVSKSVKSS